MGTEETGRLHEDDPSLDFLLSDEPAIQVRAPQGPAPVQHARSREAHQRSRRRPVTGAVYLWQLRREACRPTLSRVTAIARLFNVKPTLQRSAPEEPSRRELLLAQALQKPDISSWPALPTASSHEGTAGS